MRYHLMTGATGLLGHYLLFDALTQGIPLAVVARSTRWASARQRIDDSLARWESRLGRSLPRPVVLEGDLTKPWLGLSGDELSWVRGNCDAAIHNAASLTFVAESPEDEPYRSNVGGMSRLLEVCQETTISRLHHVSTAYVCGLRDGRILETEGDVGQQLGNDYERSKLTAELMAAEADFIDELTVYRPGIIIGDSTNGYTSTFHGFYVPLKVAHSLIQSMNVSEPMDLAMLLQLFGMKGTDRKNYVPVDWVSAAMMHIVARPEHHGQCYHLTPNQATSLIDTAEVMYECLEHVEQTGGGGTASLAGFHDVLETQMHVYQSYWRDDPVFDRTHTLRACKTLPCPEVDRAMLKRMCSYAIRSAFGWPRPPLKLADRDIHDHIRSRMAARPNTSEAWSLAFRVSGMGGGQWNLLLHGQMIVGCDEGPAAETAGEVYMNSKTFGRLVEGSLTADTALREGRLVLRGESTRHALQSVLEQLTYTRSKS